MEMINDLLKGKYKDKIKFYKISEIGKNFGGLSGKTKEDFEDGNARFISYKNIFNNPSTKLDMDDFVKVEEGEKQNCIKYKDILVAGSSETLEDSGMVSVVTEEPTEKIYLNSFCFGLRLNDEFYDKYDAEFLKHFFRDSYFRNQILKCSFGVTRYNLSKERFFNIKIPCPPLEIQKEIVSILNQFEELEIKLQSELEQRKKQYDYYRNKLLSFEEE